MIEESIISYCQNAFKNYNIKVRKVEEFIEFSDVRNWLNKKIKVLEFIDSNFLQQKKALAAMIPGLNINFDNYHNPKDAISLNDPDFMSVINFEINKFIESVESSDIVRQTKKLLTDRCGIVNFLPTNSWNMLKFKYMLGNQELESFIILSDQNGNYMFNMKEVGFFEKVVKHVNSLLGN